MTTTVLTERERRFVENYLGRAAGNATKAATLAGYSARSARELARRLLRKVDIRAAIKERVDADPVVADRVRLQRLWTAIAFAPLNGEGEFQGLQLAGLDWKDRIKASELLAKSQGAFIDRHEHAHTVQPVTIQHVHVPRDPRAPVPPTGPASARPAAVPPPATSRS